MTTNIEVYKQKEQLVYDIIISHKKIFHDLPFNKENVLNLFEALSVNDKKISLEITTDKYFNQHLNNALSKLVLNHELLRIQKGLYSFSYKIIDFKISLEQELSHLLIKDIITENKLLNTEAVILPTNIFVPEYLINEALTLEEKEIFFKKFRQYKIIKIPHQENDFVDLYSLAKFYNIKKSNKKEYIKNSYALLKTYLNNLQEQKNVVFENLLKYSKKNKKDFNFVSVSDFVKKLNKEMQLNA